MKPSRARQRELDEAAGAFDPAAHGYDFAADPRCLWGWGPSRTGPSKCLHRGGHACFRALGHPGNCGESWERVECPSRRPKNWDAVARAEANR